ncbi:hypothetical protein AV530_001186 [Patagioenas fasciata monilis]|uniref:Uncharacterized protein n=1 Tax=Patagioenas fasciata monilis TaxID=372326 RepID=A0A1V4KTK1_PATFA|nr:hypothetical protein AV530_001186 [Patagioenas fasciata monilis]
MLLTGRSRVRLAAQGDEEVATTFDWDLVEATVVFFSGSPWASLAVCKEIPQERHDCVSPLNSSLRSLGQSCAANPHHRGHAGSPQRAEQK